MADNPRQETQGEQILPESAEPPKREFNPYFDIKSFDALMDVLPHGHLTTSVEDKK